ncbi:MAG: GreA/GreB family elongation factor [Candidatus Falkowbacteria bacterium]
MQTPIRKPGQYAGIKPDPHMTPDKFRGLSAELERLKAKRPYAAAEVKRLAADGDFSENHAYSMAKGRLRGLNRRIDEIEDHLKRAVIIEVPKNPDKAVLGSLVTVSVNGREKSYRILGSSETDPSGGIISRNSPLGLALLGRRVGETARVWLKDKAVEYKIIKIA